VKDNIPPNAELIRYDYGKHKGFYFVWSSNNGWQWSALGNSGRAATKNLAMQQAHDWIVNDKID